MSFRIANLQLARVTATTSLLASRESFVLLHHLLLAKSILIVIIHKLVPGISLAGEVIWQADISTMIVVC